MSLSKAIEILTKCEADLRAQVAAAVDSGDYDAVLRITSWAKQIGVMSSSTPAAANDEKLITKISKKASLRPTYPRFLKRGEYLVKIGWSKREKSEYEHKAPYQSALLLAQATANAGKNGRIFQISALLPLIDPKDGSSTPDYQVYIVIAWWRSIGILDQHGRQGYSIPNANQYQQAVESAWMKLPEE